MTTTTADPVRLSAESRRNLVLLTACQSVGQAGNVIMLSVTALSVITFFPHRELATLPATLQHLGVMLFVFPAAAVMMRMSFHCHRLLALCNRMLSRGSKLKADARKRCTELRYRTRKALRCRLHHRIIRFAGGPDANRVNRLQIA